jgi:tyrosinase
MAQRIRRDVWKLPKWDPILLWYARAVGEMQQRPATDPASWRFQAAIHGYDSGLTPGDPPFPPNAVQDRFWNQCQHGSWFFLPWHRMYLFYFERIVADVVESLGGPPEWSLPYWNYSDPGNPDARRLPPAFRERRLEDGSRNPLFVADRDRGNNGAIVAPAQFADVSCLDNPSFSRDEVGDDHGFGGPPTAFEHGGGDIGDLETTPHGAMHVAVNGWMGMFETAALDPLFWLHHANIDRLWSVWLAVDAVHTNPTADQWLTGVAFELNDGRGAVVTHTSSEVVDSAAPLLNYTYDDLTDPRAGGLEAVPIRRRPMAKRVGEMVGATETPVVLQGRQADSAMAVRAPAGPGAGLESAAPQRFVLNIENVTGSGKPTSYRVYLNLPEGATAEGHPERYVGLLPMFGVATASRPSARSTGSGLRYTFDITAVVQTLRDAGDWDPNALRVSFVPEPEIASLESVASVPPIQVGRVSLFVS